MAKKNPKNAGYLVKPDADSHKVVFEWIGEGSTPAERAHNAWENMRECCDAPMVTVVAPDGTTSDVDLNEIE